MMKKDKKTGEQWQEEVTLTKDEGNRPSTTMDGLAGLPTVPEKEFITAGNVLGMAVAIHPLIKLFQDPGRLADR